MPEFMKLYEEDEQEEYGGVPSGGGAPKPPTSPTQEQVNQQQQGHSKTPAQPMINDYPAYGTQEYYELMFGPGDYSDLISKQQQGQAEFDAGIYGGPETGAPEPAPPAAQPSQPTYYEPDPGASPAPSPSPASIPQISTSGSSSSSSSSVSNPAPQIGTGGGPEPYTTEPGVQDEFLQLLMNRMNQGTEIDRNDPNIRQQSDAFAAGVERQKRDAISDMAERSGPLASGALRGQERMTRERAGQAIGSFEAELVGKELQNRRDEIRQALEQFGGMLDADQQRQLQRELANLDAQLKQQGLDVQSSLGGRELDIRERLGTAGLNVDLMGLLLGQQRFGDQLGFDIADREAFYNNQAVQNLF